MRLLKPFLSSNPCPLHVLGRQATPHRNPATLPQHMRARSYSVPSTLPSGETSISLILPFFVLPFSSMLSWPLNLSLYAA